MIEFLKRLFRKKEEVWFPGVLGEQNRANVYEFGEVVGAVTPAVWAEKSPDKWRVFLPQWQFKASACVAFTVAKIAQILYWNKYSHLIKFSPGWIYKQRSPKVLGMWIDNAIAIAGGGLPTEELYPSEGLDETQINALPDLPYATGVAKEFAISVNWVNLPIDFDTVASTIQQTQKGVMLWFDFGPNEFFRRPIPSILGSKLPYRHSVTGVDITRYNGENYIVIEDSAEVDGDFKHRKLISREFFKRCLLARYPISFKFDIITTRPHFNGTTRSLQDCLKFEGVMASNIQSTGFMGDLTIQAIKDFQKKYNLQQVGVLGPLTREKLLELFP